MGGGGGIWINYENYDVIYKQPLVAARSRKRKILPSSLKNVATKTEMPADGQDSDDQGNDADEQLGEEDSYLDYNIQ